MILHLHHGRRASAAPWRLPEKCAPHCEMATSLSLRLPLDCAHLPPECLGFSPHAVAVAGVRVCFRMVANILQTTYFAAVKEHKITHICGSQSSRAWFPETNRLFRLHRPISKDPIAFSKIWTISKAIIWQSTYFYMYNMLNVCRVRSLAAFCNGCFSFQFECNESTASSGYVGPRHEASAAHRQTDAERDRHVFFSIDFVRLSLAVGLGWWFGCSL